MTMLFWLVLVSISVQYSPAFAKWQSSGSLQGSYQQYSLSPSEESVNAAAGINGQWKLDLKSQKNWRLKSDLEFQTDQISKDPSEKFRFNPQSFYLENRSSEVTVRVGYQTIIPEGPDFLNPADVIHSKDWKDPTHPRSLGSAGISMSHEGTDWQWEAFYVPQQTKPKFPGDRSPWWPRGKRIPIESDDTEFQVPSDIKYKVSDSEEIGKALSQNYALRLGHKGAAFEGQLVYYEGLSQDPNLVIDSSGTLLALSPKLILLMNSPVILKPLFYRHRVFAGTFVLPLETWAVKGGANQTKPLSDDTRLPGEVTTGVLGVEKNFETAKGLVTLILQHEVQKRQAKNQISFLKSIYENAWTFGFRVPWGEDLQILGGLIYNTNENSSVARFGGTYRWTDSLSSEIELQFLQGPPETLLGLYDNYDSASVGLTYHF